MLHNNLAEAPWPVEGPAAALEVLQAGIAFAQARGLTGTVDVMTAGICDQLRRSGRHEDALELAAETADRAEASGNVLNLATARSVQISILTLSGQVDQTVDRLDWLETITREAASIESTIENLAAVAAAHAALGHRHQAAALLSEVETAPEARETPYYAASLPAMVRTALAIDNLELAEQLAARVEPRTPSAEHALLTANAALHEAHGDQRSAAQGYADAAQRWETFGVVPEQAFALLGQGRSQLAVGQHAEAAQALQRARAIFQTLQAAPALAETDLLLQQAAALSA